MRWQIVTKASRSAVNFCPYWQSVSVTKCAVLTRWGQILSLNSKLLRLFFINANNGPLIRWGVLSDWLGTSEQVMHAFYVLKPAVETLWAVFHALKACIAFIQMSRS